MTELIAIIAISLAISLDAFSVSLGIGTIGISKSKQLKLILVVGILHFIMPLIGINLGGSLLYHLKINAHFLMAVILLFIAFGMIKNVLICKDKEYDLSTIGILVLAFSVSIDSFTIGIGMGHITSNSIIAALFFSTTSILFTYLGLSIGKYSKKLLGTYATVFGAILLITISVVSFLM